MLQHSKGSLEYLLSRPMLQCLSFLSYTNVHNSLRYKLTTHLLRLLEVFFNRQQAVSDLISIVLHLFSCRGMLNSLQCGMGSAHYLRPYSDILLLTFTPFGMCVESFLIGQNIHETFANGRLTTNNKLANNIFI